MISGAANLPTAKKSTPSQGEPVTVELKHNQAYETSKLSGQHGVAESADEQDPYYSMVMTEKDAHDLPHTCDNNNIELTQNTVYGLNISTP